MNQPPSHQPTSPPRSDRHSGRKIRGTRSENPRRVYCSTGASHVSVDLQSLLMELEQIAKDDRQTAICIIEDITTDWIKAFWASKILTFPRSFFQDFRGPGFSIPEPQPWIQPDKDDSSWHVEGEYSIRSKRKTRLSYCRARSNVCELPPLFCMCSLGLI